MIFPIILIFQAYLFLLLIAIYLDIYLDLFSDSTVESANKVYELSEPKHRFLGVLFSRITSNYNITR
jgi:hypothetical protein